MTQLLYPIFYKIFGVRRLQNMFAPKANTITTLPRASMVHFLGSEEHMDVDVSKLYYGNTTRKILIDFPTVLTSTLGNPRSHFVDLRSKFKPFITDNRKFRFLKDAYLQVDDVLTLFVNNYSYSNLVYKYVPTPITEYHKWFNQYKSIFDNIELINKTSIKNHFVFIDVPKVVPSFGLLTIYKDKANVSMLKIFDSGAKLFILELFKWLDSERATLGGIFSGLTVETYSKINLCFSLSNGQSVILNMGFLNSWIKGNENVTDVTTVTQINNVTMQKLLIKMLLSMQSVTTEVETSDEAVAVTDEDKAEDDEIVQAQAEYDQNHSLNDDEDEHSYQDALSFVNRLSGNTKLEKNKPLPKAAPIEEPTDKMLDSAFDTEGALDAQLAELDNDMSVLEDTSSRSLLLKGFKVEKTGDINDSVVSLSEMSQTEIHNKVYVAEDVKTSLNRQIETQVDFGLLTASDYRGLKKDIEEFSKSKDPYGSGQSIEDVKRIDPEILKLNTIKTQIDSSHIVQDKSMLHSSLQSFDQDYILHVMKKDMLSMTDGIQKAGVVIRKHEVETEHSVLGSYNMHTLELKPVDGQASTIRFRVPVVNVDGTITSSGNRMVLRKLRVDLPIRKIKPTEVALTSYYGKTFVKLNPKKTNNSVEWLIKELNIASMTEGGFIQRVNPAKVFDNNFKAPFIYNALADNFKSIVTESFTLQFDHTERKNLVNDIQLEALEKDGARVVGLTNRKMPIVVDKDNQFQVSNQNGDLSLLGDIYDTLRINAAKSPVDFAEVNIFSKSVPLAVVLGYSLGFKNLLKFLGARYRVAESRKDKELTKDEYAIHFKDVTYVLSRKDKVPSRILNGFNDFEKQIKQYEVDDFNHKDIYLNLLESKGLSSIYIREIDLMQQLFVDPITKGILEQMKEPVTFNGLLVRSAELLDTYHHPDSQDMSQMRIRGYERISGSVYKDLVTSMRQFRNRNIAGRSKIEMSPYQIWTSIMKDPAMKIVEDINPIQNLKESEIVTYSGEGGRGKDSMNKASRAYHKNDMGIISEATVDSSDVGVNVYLSANPKFKDLRGLANLDNANINPSSLVSTSTLLAPGSDSDD